MFKVNIVRVLWIFALILSSFNSLQAQVSLPPLFSDQLVKGNLNQVTCFERALNNKIYVAEKRGYIWIMDTNGVKQAQPLINLTEEVGNWVDHGLNGFTLDPDFIHNGYFYLFYTVDRHYLMNYGTLQYNSATNEYFNATIVRVTRYQADSTTNFTTIINNSRQVLIGQTKSNGIPLTHLSHSGGTLKFGEDGSLLISTGDGASYTGIDTGNCTNSYWYQAMQDSILRPAENVGSFRSLMLDSYNGKILRIDPATGLGLPSNPFYDPLHPESVRSKIWCTGLRNPFRFAIMPNSGSTDITAGDPGTLLIGEVGWATWEDFNVSKTGGENFGWPLYEGLTSQSQYQNALTENLDAPNPLFGINGCTRQYFRFKELFLQATKDPNARFANPCNNPIDIPANIYKAFQTRPQIDWKHDLNITRVPTFTGNTATNTYTDSLNSPVKGPGFKGNASVGGVWYTDTKFPLQYQNSYYHADYGGQWIKQFKFKGDNITSVDSFASNAGAAIYLTTGKYDGCIWYVNYPTEIRKICYTGLVNNPPIAIAQSNLKYGPSPLSIQFNGSSSFDPENSSLTFKWRFGDGDTSIAMNPSHTYTNGAITKYYALLEVTDNIGNKAYDSVLVSINNTPPLVNIASPADSSFFNNITPQLFTLAASVTDLEHPAAQLQYQWQVTLIHNNHLHPQTPDSSVSPIVQIDPTGCDDIYSYVIVLKVTDAAGLSTSDTVRIFPTCPPPQAGFTVPSVQVCKGQQVMFTDTSKSAAFWYWEFPGGTPSVSNNQNPAIVYNTPGNYDVKLIVTNPYGQKDSIIKSNYIHVNAVPQVNFYYNGSDSVCPNEPVLMSAYAAGPNTYQWYKNNLILAGQTDDTLYQTGIGEYKVIVSSNKGCITTKTKVLAAKKVTASILTNKTAPFCYGDSVCLFITNGNSFNSFSWKKGTTALANTNNDSIYVKKDGNYSIVASSIYGCSATSSKFNIDFIPNILLSSSGSLTFCNGDSVKLITTYYPNYTYQWKRNGVNIAGATSNTYTAKIAGNYAVKVGTLGCFATSTKLFVVINCRENEPISGANDILLQPNPVESSTKLSFVNPKAQELIIALFDMDNRLVKQLENKYFEAGAQQVELKLKQQNSGVYFIKIMHNTEQIGITRLVKL